MTAQDIATSPRANSRWRAVALQVALGVLTGIVFYALLSSIIWTIVQDELLASGLNGMTAMAIVALLSAGLARLTMRNTAFRIAVAGTLLIVTGLVLAMPTPQDAYFGAARTVDNWILYFQPGARFYIAPAIAACLLALGRSGPAKA